MRRFEREDLKKKIYENSRNPATNESNIHTPKENSPNYGSHTCFIRDILTTKIERQTLKHFNFLLQYLNSQINFSQDAS